MVIVAGRSTKPLGVTTMSKQDPVFWVAYGAGMVIGALIVGVVCGLLPFFLGRRHGQRKLAMAGFITSIVVSLIGGAVIAVPTAIIFTVVIVVRRRSIKTAGMATNLPAESVQVGVTPNNSFEADRGS